MFLGGEGRDLIFVFFVYRLLQNNNINGLIPAEIGKLTKLKTLDLSSNHFSGEIPSSAGHLESLQYLRLNNNTLSGAFPSSSANLSHLIFLDLSYNNLSGPIPGSLTRTFNIVGNPLICAATTEQDCYGSLPMPMSYSLNNTQGTLMPAKAKNHKVAIALGATIGCITLLFLGVDCCSGGGIGEPDRLFSTLMVSKMLKLLVDFMNSVLRLSISMASVANGENSA
jgi:hypothetical protein